MISSQSKLATILLMVVFSVGVYALEEKIVEKPDFNSMIENNAKETQGISNSLREVYTGDSSQNTGKAVPANGIQVDRDNRKSRTHRGGTVSHET